MKVAYFPTQVSTVKTTLVLGAFESVHNGHRKLIETAIKLGKRVAVMMIANPSELPGSPKEEFASLDVRLEHLADLTVDYVSVVKFDENMRLMDGKEFVKQIMVATKAENLIMGSDFACGRGGEYKAKDIAKDFANVTIVDVVKQNDKKIATSLLREMVNLGHVDVIREISPFAFEVKVNVDSKGFFKFDKEPKLHAGIYATTAIINDIRYWSYVHVNQAGVMKITVPDLQLKNSPFDAHIAFIKMVRIVVSSDKDKLDQADVTRVATYLKNNI